MPSSQYLLNNGVVAQGVVVFDDAGGNAFPTGGGGSSLSNLAFQDGTGQMFFYQDKGAGLESYKLQDGAYVAYTPTGTITQVALPAGASTSALQTTGNTSLSSIDGKLPTSIGGRIPVEPLGIPGVARQQPTTVANANVVLTVGVRRISLFARIAPLRYVVGSTAQTANSATSHYLAAGERIDIDVPTTPNIAVIRASDATADGAAEITELS